MAASVVAAQWASRVMASADGFDAVEVRDPAGVGGPRHCFVVDCDVADDGVVPV
jgi:hypothetical protein